MKKCSTIAILAAAAVLVLFGATPTAAQPYAASASVEDDVTVSGTWTSVQWYESDGCYSGVGDPAVEDWKTHPQSNTTVNLSTTASDTYGAASSSILVHAPSMVPTINIDSDADISGLPLATGHWASAFSQGGANWLTSGADQDVTVTIQYSYDLDLSTANPDSPYAFVKIYVAFWGPASQLLLTADSEFVAEGNYLVKTVQIDTKGTSTGTVTGSKDWVVSVTNGSFYSFWSMAWVEVYCADTPVPAQTSTWGMLKSLYR
jgi:hypothetical protein